MGQPLRTMGIVFGSIDVEQASYTVEATIHQPPLGTIEVRKYHSALAAQVDSGTSSEDQAFKNLARYIGVFGTPQNQGAGTAPETVAMTAPVVHPSRRPHARHSAKANQPSGNVGRIARAHIRCAALLWIHRS